MDFLTPLGNLVQISASRQDDGPIIIYPFIQSGALLIISTMHYRQDHFQRKFISLAH